MNIEKFLKAQQLMSAGHYVQAVAIFDSILDTASEPDDRAAVLSNEAMCYSKLGKLQMARRAWNGAIRVAPRSEEYAANLEFLDATLCIAEKKPKDALKKLSALLRKHEKLLATPDYRYLYEEAQVRRGMLLVDLNRSSEACRILEEAREFESAHEPIFFYNLGVCYFDLKDWAASKNSFANALRLHPSEHYTVRIHYYLGILSAKLGAGAQAYDHFVFAAQHAGSSDVPPAQIYNWLWRLCDEMGLEREARKFEELEKEHLAKDS